MKIKPTDKTIKETFESGFYKIPRFQRPYSWDKENISDFWADITNFSSDNYFIGAMIFSKNSELSDEYLVVDGQQRLTTIVILLCALRNAFVELGEEKLAHGLQKIIERPNIDYDLKYVLFSETPYPYFQDTIQNMHPSSASNAVRSEERTLRDAFNEMNSSIQRHFLSINNNAEIKNTDKKKEKLNFLKRIRDKILGLQHIVIELDNEDDAYVIFETINTRGKDLEAADLVKSHLTKLLKPRNKQHDVAKDSWNKILSTIDQAPQDVTVSAFLHHHWLSYTEYVTEVKLFKSIKSDITSKNAKEYLDMLVEEVSYYRTIFEPGFGGWSKEESKIRDSLTSLQTFRVKQVVPTMLAIMVKYKRGEISTKQCKKILGDLEKFHFLFTAVTQQRGSGGISFMYSRAGRDIRHANTEIQKDKSLSELTQKLKDRVPTFAEFELGLQNVLYSNFYRRQRALVRYICQNFHSFLNPNSTVDYDKYTIEHIANQSTKSFVQEDIASLGNLILVSSKVNSEKLRNKNFIDKKAILLDAGENLDPVIMEAKKWGASEIKHRQDYIADVSYNKIWRL